MRPLLPRDITASFLTERPFLLLNASAFDTRYVGHLLVKGIAIKSKGGTSLPTETWLHIFTLLFPKRPTYHLARPLRVRKSDGEYTTLECEVDPSSLISSPDDVDNEDEVYAIERHLATPDKGSDPFVLGYVNTPSLRPAAPSRYFTITVTDDDDRARDGTFLPACLFRAVTVPDLISRVSGYKCSVCRFRRGHTICPGCTGGVSERYGARMGCGVDLACPLCLGLDFMRKDKRLLEAYYHEGLPEEEERRRRRRFAARLKELGYGDGS